MKLRIWLHLYKLSSPSPKTFLTLVNWGHYQKSCNDGHRGVDRTFHSGAQADLGYGIDSIFGNTTSIIQQKPVRIEERLGEQLLTVKKTGISVDKFVLRLRLFNKGKQSNLRCMHWWRSCWFWPAYLGEGSSQMGSPGLQSWTLYLDYVYFNLYLFTSSPASSAMISNTFLFWTK